jgi:hypothetical protein
MSAMARMTGAGWIAAALAALFATAPGAEAQFRMEFSYCDRLQSQYLSAAQQASGGGGGQRMLQIDQLSRQLAAAQIAAQRNNCGGGAFFFMGPAAGRACPAINAEIYRLSRQLSQLRGPSYGLFGYSPEQEAMRLRDVLAESGCGVPMATGTRALCVRLCDGYYFPIDAQANSTRFQTDAVACQSMYAEGGQAELFVQPSGADIADATSLVSGRRYGDLPTALHYRDTYEPACAAQLKTGIAALVARYRALLPTRNRPAAVSQIRRFVPVPQARPPASEDPETLANAAGGFRIEPVTPGSAAVVADAAPRTVRMVGAAYYAELFDLAKVRQQQALRPSLSLIGSAVAAEAPAAASPQPAAPLPVGLGAPAAAAQ